MERATGDDILRIVGLTTEFRGRHSRIRANDDIHLVGPPRQHAGYRRANPAAASRCSAAASCGFCRRRPMHIPTAPSSTMVVTCSSLSEEEMRRLRGTELSMIFQNPDDQPEPGLAHRRPDH